MVVREQNQKESGYKYRKYGVIESKKFQSDPRAQEARKWFKAPITNYGSMCSNKTNSINNTNSLTNK